MLELSSLPWNVLETENRLELCHDHRWLAIVGIPMILIGTTAAIGLWFIPGVSYGDGWPIMSAGSLMGTGLVVLGLHLSLNREYFVVNSPLEMALDIRH